MSPGRDCHLEVDGSQSSPDSPDSPEVLIVLIVPIVLIASVTTEKVQHPTRKHLLLSADLLATHSPNRSSAWRRVATRDALCKNWSRYGMCHGPSPLVLLIFWGSAAGCSGEARSSLADAREGACECPISSLSQIMPRQASPGGLAMVCRVARLEVLQKAT